MLMRHICGLDYQLKEKERQRLLNEYIQKLKGQLPAIKDYVVARHSQYTEFRTKE